MRLVPRTIGEMLRDWFPPPSPNPLEEVIYDIAPTETPFTQHLNVHDPYGNRLA